MAKFKTALVATLVLMAVESDKNSGLKSLNVIRPCLISHKDNHNLDNSKKFWNDNIFWKIFNFDGLFFKQNTVLLILLITFYSETFLN